ncbi:MAG: CotH kinase family protein [Firmicutes bacterium]|nr:CotH kinase family protein [Bacillota bacterium]
MLDNKNTGKIALAVMVLAVIILLVFMLTYRGTASAGGYTMTYESTLFDTSQIIEINIDIDEADWQQLLDTATYEEYYTCDVTVNGTTYKNVGIRPKGNTSLTMVASSDSDRYSFKLKFDEYVDNQTCEGLSKLVLNNNYADATMMKEAIVYDMFAYLDTDASLYNYAKVSVNGEYSGVYLALEPVEEEFALRNYGNSYGEFYKPDSMEMGGAGKMKDFKVDDVKEILGFGEDTAVEYAGNVAADDSMNPDKFHMPGDMQRPNMNTGGEGFSSSIMPDMGGDFGGNRGSFGGGGSGGSSTSLNYIDDELSSYSTIWNSSVFQSTDADHQRVITALKNLCADNVDTETLEQYMDVDNMLKYMAVHTFSVNLDSLSGNMAHNYYLYENDGRINMVPWDYNLSFGGFQSGDATSTINFPIDTPFSSGIDMSESRKIFAALLNNEDCLAKYHEYLRILSEEYVGGGRFTETYERIRSQIDGLVAEDPTSFFTYEEYKAGTQTLVEVVNLRAESISGQLDGTVPSTHEGQNANPDALIDCTDIDISVMGSMTGGGGKDGFSGGARGDRGDRPERGDGSQMPDSMENFDPSQIQQGGGFGGMVQMPQQ